MPPTQIHLAHNQKDQKQQQEKEQRKMILLMKN